jgi:hypothetical protein
VRWRSASCGHRTLGAKKKSRETAAAAGHEGLGLLPLKGDRRVAHACNTPEATQKGQGHVVLLLHHLLLAGHQLGHALAVLLDAL